MNYRMRIAILLSILAFEIVAVGAAYAAPVTLELDTDCFTIQHDGVTAFEATGIATQVPPYTTVNYTGTCGAPPNPPNDPNALTNIFGKITNHACANYSTSNGQEFGTVFGLGYNPPATTWPFAPSTSVSMTLPPLGRYYGGVFTSGANPGILPHYLKLNAYAGSCGLSTPLTARFNVRVVPVGNTAAPVGRCTLTNVPPDGSPLVQFKFAGPVNSAHCLGVIGGSYRYIVENASATGSVLALLTYN